MLNGEIIPIYKTLNDLVQDPLQKLVTLEMVYCRYTYLSAERHVAHTRAYLGFPSDSETNQQKGFKVLSRGLCNVGLSLQMFKPELTEQLNILNKTSFEPVELLFEAGFDYLPETSEHISLLGVRELQFSKWNPPPTRRKLQGDLFYLTLVTVEMEEYCITACTTGFFVNKGNNDYFNPEPASDPHTAFRLISLIYDISEGLKMVMAAEGTVRTSLDEISLTLPRYYFPYVNTLVKDHEYVPDVSCVQEGLALNSHERFEIPSEGYFWCEKIEEVRETPRGSAQSDLFRERSLVENMERFVETALEGASFIFNGAVEPMNPEEEQLAQTYYWNNIIFSYSDHSKGRYQENGGRDASRHISKKDVHSASLLYNLDIEGLSSCPLVVIDYLGRRLVAQASIPGVLGRTVGYPTGIVYGYSDNEGCMITNEIVEPYIKIFSDSCVVKPHIVFDGNEKGYYLHSSVDMNIVQGADGRLYLLDTGQNQPLDLLFYEQCNVDGMPEYPHSVAMLRIEAIQEWFRLTYKNIRDLHSNILDNPSSSNAKEPLNSSGDCDDMVSPLSIDELAKWELEVEKLAISYGSKRRECRNLSSSNSEASRSFNERHENQSFISLNEPVLVNTSNNEDTKETFFKYPSARFLKKSNSTDTHFEEIVSNNTSILGSPDNMIENEEDYNVHCEGSTSNTSPFHRSPEETMENDEIINVELDESSSIISRFHGLPENGTDSNKKLEMSFEKCSSNKLSLHDSPESLAVKNAKDLNDESVESFEKCENLGNNNQHTKNSFSKSDSESFEELKGDLVNTLCERPPTPKDLSPKICAMEKKTQDCLKGDEVVKHLQYSLAISTINQNKQKDDEYGSRIKVRYNEDMSAENSSLLAKLKLKKAADDDDDDLRSQIDATCEQFSRININACEQEEQNFFVIDKDVLALPSKRIFDQDVIAMKAALNGMIGQNLTPDEIARVKKYTPSIVYPYAHTGCYFTSNDLMNYYQNLYYQGDTDDRATQLKKEGDSYRTVTDWYNWNTRNLGALKVTVDQFKLNPDVPLDINLIPEGQVRNEYVKDGIRIVDACCFLQFCWIPNFVRDICTEAIVMPMDGLELTEAMHSRGINMRYLGRIAKLCDNFVGITQELLFNVVVDEITARCAKHVLNDILILAPIQYGSIFVVDFFNVFFGSMKTEELVFTEKEKCTYVGTSYGNIRDLYDKITPQFVYKAILLEAKKRFRFKFENYSNITLNQHQLFRRLSQMLGLQWKLFGYDLKPGRTDYPFFKEGPKFSSGVVDQATPRQSLKKRRKSGVQKGSIFLIDNLLNIVPTFISTSFDSLIGFSNILYSEKACDRPMEAVEYTKKAYESFDYVYKGFHPVLIDVIQKYAWETWIYEKDVEKVIKLQRRAIFVSEKLTGIDSPQTLTCYIKLMTLLGCFENFVAALHVAQRCLKIISVYHDHRLPELVKFFKSLATIFKTNRIYQTAIEWLDLSLSLTEENTVAQALTNLDLYENLAECNLATHRFTEAKFFYMSHLQLLQVIDVKKFKIQKPIIMQTIYNLDQAVQNPANSRFFYKNREQEKKVSFDVTFRNLISKNYESTEKIYQRVVTYIQKQKNIKRRLGVEQEETQQVPVIAGTFDNKNIDDLLKYVNGSEIHEDSEKTNLTQGTVKKKKSKKKKKN